LVNAEIVDFASLWIDEEIRQRTPGNRRAIEVNFYLVRNSEPLPSFDIPENEVSKSRAGAVEVHYPFPIGRSYQRIYFSSLDFAPSDEGGIELYRFKAGKIA